MSSAIMLYAKCPSCLKTKPFDEESNFCGKCGTRMEKIDMNKIEESKTGNQNENAASSLATADTENNGSKTNKRKSPSMDNLQVNLTPLSPAKDDNKRLKYDENSIVFDKQTAQNDKEIKREKTISESSGDEKGSVDLYEAAYNRSTSSSDDENANNEKFNKNANNNNNNNNMDVESNNVNGSGVEVKEKLNEICTQIGEKNVLQISIPPSTPPSVDQERPPPSPTRNDLSEENIQPPASPKPEKKADEINESPLTVNLIRAALEKQSEKLNSQVKRINYDEYIQSFENPKLPTPSLKPVQAAKNYKKQHSQAGPVTLGQIMESNDKINVHFSAAVPIYCVRDAKNFHVRITFLYDDTKELLNVSNLTNMQIIDNNDLIRVDTVAQIPRVLIEKKSVIYLYNLETSDQTDTTNNKVEKVFEQLFTELEQVRYLNFELKSQNLNQKYRNREMHRVQNPLLDFREMDVQTNVFQFDGLILFNNDLHYSKPEDLNMYKLTHLKTENPIRNLMDFKPDVIFNNNIKFFEVIQRLYDCLCSNDQFYKQHFEKILTNIFKIKLTCLANKQIHEELDHIIAATIFYLSHLFKFKITEDVGFVNNLLRFLDVNNLTTYGNFNTVFTNEKKQFCEVMKMFLNELNKKLKLPYSIYVLNLYYSVVNYVKHDDVKADRYFLELSKNLFQFIDITYDNTLQRNEKDRLKGYFESSLHHEHANFGALLLNYFCLNNEDNFKEIVQFISFDAIINYLNALFLRHNMSVNEKEFKMFENLIDYSLKNTKAYFAKNCNHVEPLIEHFCKVIKSAHNPHMHDIAYTKTRKLINLLRNITKVMPKNWRLILKLVEIILIFCEATAIVRARIRSNQMIMGGFDYYNDESDDFNNLIDIMKKWINKECSEDILITFGLKERSKEDIAAFENELRRKEEEKLRKLQKLKHKMNNEKDDEIESDLQMDVEEQYDFESDNEDVDDFETFIDERNFEKFNRKKQIQTRSIYFGINDEPAFYSNLLNIDLQRLITYRHRFKEFLVETIIHTRFKNSDFESLITIRSRISDIMKHFGVRIRLDEFIDKAIFEQILDANRNFKPEKNSIATLQIEKMVNIIGEKHLIQKYLTQLLSDIYQRMERNTNILLDYSRENRFDGFHNSSAFGSLVNPTNQHQAKFLQLKLILSWPQFTLVFDKYFNQNKQILDEKCAANFTQWVKRLLETLEGIIDGSECPVYIRLLSSYQENLISLLSKLKLKNPVEYYNLLIKTRIQEIDEFESYYQSLKKFTTICRKYENTCKLKVYEDILQKFYSEVDFDLYIFKPIKTFLAIVNIKDLTLKEKYTPKITFFPEIDHVLMKEIKEINSLKRNFCVLFDNYFLDECKKQVKINNNQPIDIKIIIKQVWPQTVQRLKFVATQIDNGAVKLKEIDEFNREHYRDKEKMLNEFNYICDYFNMKNFPIRRDQIILYYKFKTTVRGAHEIEKIRQQLKLKFRFTELEPLLKISTDESKDWNLLKMNETVRTTVEVLSKMDSTEKLDCLTAFVESNELVEWLRKNTVDIMGLKFLVDLASASTNEPNADRDLLARALKDSGTAFAPLIYDLKADDNFKKFMDHCEKVWHFLEDDKHISDKLLEIRNKIALLDEIKQKGNVEVSSIKQAKMFNERGVYYISIENAKEVSAKSGKATDGDSKADSIDKIILLKVDVEEDEYTQKTKIGTKRVTKTYTYQQLKEQQNILMLVAKKSTQINEDDDESKTLDYFLEIFDGITRLAELYLKLIKTGCIIFNKFEAVIYCDILNTRVQSKKEVASIKFYSEDIKDFEASTKQSLTDLCTFMESSFKLWQSYVIDLREKHDSLNYLTISQIVYLREKLGVLCVNEKNEKRNELNVEDFTQVCWLLRNIYKDINQDLLKRVFDEVSKFLAEEARSEQLVEYDTKLTEVINRIAKANNYKIELVKHAVDLCGIADETQILQYCLENEHTFEEVKKQVKPEIFAVKTKLSFREKIQKTWRDFMKNQNQSSKNFISIKELALLLDQLKHKEIHERAEFKRNKPGYLTYKGQPNLIIVPSSEVMSTVLSIYAESGMMCPLPSNDECLFCTTETTGEEIEIFLRIALKSNGNKIYTLINVQDLNYEAANHAERCFSRINDASKEYLLVIMCSTEKQSQSILVSTFFKYKVHQLVPRTIGDLQRYLKAQLQNHTNNNQFASSKLDPEKLTVRTLLSDRPGAGKSLYVKNIINDNSIHGEFQFGYKVLPIKTTELCIDTQIEQLFQYLRELRAKKVKNTLYHIDIAYEVFEGVDEFLFNLTILGCLRHSNGQVWRRDSGDLYIIEVMPPLVNMHSDPTKTEKKAIKASINSPDCGAFHYVLNYLPKIYFRQPKKYLYDLENNCENDSGMNDTRINATSIYDKNFERVYKDDKYQCTCHYLRLLKQKTALEIASFKYYDTKTKPVVLKQNECLKILIENSILYDPTWSELNNFVSFFNENLRDSEHSTFLGNASASELGDFKAIFLRLIVHMSHDFALPSLNISEESPNQDRMMIEQTQNDAVNEFDLNKMTIKRHWERLTHPYVLFNADHQTFTFMGLYLERKNYKFLDTNTEKPITDFDTESFKIDAKLRMQLLTQRVPIFKSFNKDYQRKDRIDALRNVMGLCDNGQRNYDPDPTYELTIDNCLKMMAIYLRFRCNIPVMIMGETGCGKTRLIKYLSDLHLNQNVSTVSKVLMHVKVHGGTTAEIIKDKLNDALKLSIANFSKLYASRKITSETNVGDIPASCILFFDEANTTEAIGLIKEIMCDSTCNGVAIDFRHGLKIIAACNPYKKHSDAMIEKLEQAGLGFYKSANDTKEKLGHIPMRQLVYRVQPLPGSLLPLVWDFGQLNNDVEKVYIKQMLKRATEDKRLPSDTDAKELDKLSELLTVSQAYMRDRKDECSFVSLRDIERVIKVASWFFSKQTLIFTRMNRREIKGYNDRYQEELKPLRRSFVLALVVCYHASLQDPTTRKEYRQLIEKTIPIEEKFLTESSRDWILIEILKVENVFLDEIELNKNIARNGALLENVFMMTICVELRIPLFLVGKPGSSKSLAKTIVANAMQGKNSKSEFYKNLKEAYFVNFQCSPLTTPEMIVKAFKEAAKFQLGKNLETSVAVVNLDEIGLAEASDSMPLKTLHPLLEEGNDTDEESKPFEKVGVIGISNWALDPAKMNRGIFVCRSEPTIGELVESALGICNYDQHIFKNIEPHIEDISKSYLKLCKTARESKREFFGLRDFYSLIKMIYWFCSKDINNLFTWNKLEHAVKRNFSGLDIDPIEAFKELKYKSRNPIDQTVLENDPKCNPIDLVQAALRGDNIESNSRYLLLLTENYAILDIVQNYLLNIVKVENHNLVTIFGSSFRNDQQYTEVCRNISRIKHSMEIGNTVILLNFDNLYESLYDALNQYYHYFAGQKFVDLGLGTHRVKCSVHDEFRLIVIAEKRSVYDTKRFPIPLINRLEKHYLSATTMLTKEQEEIVKIINDWIVKFCNCGGQQQQQEANDVFIGYHDDTIATIVLYLDQERSLTTSTQQQDNESTKKLIDTAKSMLLQCATSDSIARLSSSKQANIENKDSIWNEYFTKQKHSSLKDMIKYHLKYIVNPKHSQQQQLNKHLLQITTNSKLLITKADLHKLAAGLGFNENDSIKIKDNFSSCLLNSFDTQQQFINKLREFIYFGGASTTTSTSESMQVDPYNEDNDVDMTASTAASVSLLKRLFVIQIDLTIDTKHIFDLISCTRHVLVEECKNAIKLNKLNNTFICLVINIPRENCSQFIGFQVNYWSCYHVDDIEEPPNDIPTFDLLKDKSLSTLIDDSLKNYQQKSLIEQNDYIDLSTLLHKCAYYACSFIKDDNLKRTIERIDIFIRLSNNNTEFLKQITKYIIDLQKEKESYNTSGQMQNWFINEVAKLDNIKKYSTLRKAAQNYIETKISPLLGYILSFVDNYFNLDVLYKEQETENKTKNSWKLDLWLSILKNNDILRIKYENMLSKEQKEVNKFQCKSQWSISTIVSETELMQVDSITSDTLSHLKPKLPFCWLLIITLNELYENFIELNRNKIEKDAKFEFEQYKTTISQLFEKTQFYNEIERSIKCTADKEEKNSTKFSDAIQQEMKNELLEDYINDFILYNCKIKTVSDLNLITKTIHNKISNRIDLAKVDLKICLPIVHYEYEKLRSKIDLYLKFVKLEPEIIKSLEETFKSSDKSNYIDIESCLLCMKKYKQMLGVVTVVDNKNETDGIKSNLNELSIILQLTSSLLTQMSSEDDVVSGAVKQKSKRDEIIEQYESLKVTQLFIENILLTQLPLTQYLNKPSLCKQLSNKTLSKDVNFRAIQTFRLLNEFMIFCIDHSRNVWFDYKNVSKCCKKPCLDYYELGCKCKACAGCIKNLKNGMTKNCPVCKKPAGNITHLIEIDQTRSAYNEFIDKLNNFYLNIMELIVFNENHKASIQNEIINLLMNLLTEARFRKIDVAVLGEAQRISEDNKYDGLVFEFKPQYCSLLLQILYKNNKEVVRKYLSDWFRRQESQYKVYYKPHVENDFVLSVNNIALFYVNCVYDYLVQDNNEVGLLKQCESALTILRREILTGSQDYDTILKIFKQDLKYFDVQALNKIAYLKYAILVFAYLLSNYRIYKMNNKIPELDALDNINFELKRIIEATHPQTKTVCYFLIKELIRKYGSAIIKDLPTIQLFKWIVPDKLIATNDKPADRFVLIGQKYTSCKAAIRETISTNKHEDLVKFIKSKKDNIFPYIYLALYQEVTLLYKSMPSNTIPIRLFESVLKETYPEERIQHWSQLLENNFNHHLKVLHNDLGSNPNLDLSSVLIQFRISVFKSRSKLVKPFIDLMNFPAKMKDSFLPTMQQDVTFDIQKALLESRGHDNPKFYACPNGHPYVLFDCGRPWVIMKCRECNADIGGTQHKLLENNKELNVTDTTMRGYCLNEASTLSDTPQSERSLTQPAYHVTRFFLHCALYYACDKDEKSVKAMMIREPASPKDFFWNHLNKDLYLIGKALNLNPDEVYIILHSILNDILGSTQNVTYDRWDSKDARQGWENSFADLCLQSAFRETQSRIRRATEAMKKDAEDDTTSGKAELYFMAYELSDLDNKNENCIYENKEFWRFRPVVSFNTMAIELQNTTEQTTFILLRKFIELKDKLECVFNLPHIIKLVNLLQKYLSKTIFKEYASKHTLRNCLETNLFQQQTSATSATAQLNHKLKEEFERDIEKLQMLWIRCKHDINSYIAKEMPNTRITVDNDHEFNLDSKLSYFLPAMYGDGFVIYAMIKYLASIHNEFLNEYKNQYRVKAQTLQEVDINLFENPEFIVQFNTKGNLLRLITSNYEYDSRNSKLIFHYDKIQRQLIESFIQTKPLINTNNLQKLILFEYSEEMNDMEILIRLNNVIQQELLDEGTQKAIYDDFKQINETSEALHVLKTVINFACTTSSNSEVQISEFIKAIYSSSQADTKLKSKITESCKLKHLKHIWLIIMMKRAVLFSINNQEPFEMLDDVFRKKLDDVHEIKLSSNPIVLVSLALVFYQMITLFIYPLKSFEDKRSYSSYSVSDTFLTIEDIDIGKIQMIFPSNMQPAYLHGVFSNTVTLANTYDIWKNIVSDLAKA